ncbi:MAG: hypothetical protein WD595_03450 [Waddliaceae bacterium]
MINVNSDDQEYYSRELSQFMQEIHDEGEVKINEVNSEFLNSRRELAERSGSIAKNHFNLLAEYVNKQAGANVVMHIAHPSVQAAGNNIEIERRDAKNLVISALGSAEFGKKDVDKVIKLAKEKSASHIDLSNCMIGDMQLKEVAEIESLRSIDLHESSFFGTSLVHLSKLRSLERINLRGCGTLEDEDLKFLSDHPNLRDLDISECDRITDIGIGHLAGLINLQSLDLTACLKVTDEGIKIVSALKQLEHLQLMGLENITDESLEYLANLPNLQTLDLMLCTQVTEKGLVKLAVLEDLDSVSILYCEAISEEIIESVKNLKGANLRDELRAIANGE